jgi:hypothetical protein
VRLDVGLARDARTVYENVDPPKRFTDLIDDIRNVGFIR